MACLRSFCSVVTGATSKSFDVVIAGGGVVGSSVAYHLARDSPGLRIAVVERDSSYAHASAPLSAGGIRQQFSMRENILMSLYGVQFLKNVGTALQVEGNEVPSVQLHEGGYLFMASTEQGEAVLRRNHERVRRTAGLLGVPTL